MVRSLLLFTITILVFSGRIEGQACLPDSMYIDSSGFVFPLPYDSLNNPMGGIDKEACINQEFEFTWTLKVPDTVLFPGIPIPIPVDYFRIDTIGAISNLPSGLTYKCNPPNCLFDAGSLGCVIIQGTPLPALPLGDSSKVREGDEIAFTGFPIGMVLGLYPVTHRGIVAAITPIARPVENSRTLNAAQLEHLRRSRFDTFQLDATAYPGNSGSPVYEVATGRVIGVLNSVFVKESKESVLEKPSGISYAIPINLLKPLLSKAR